MTPGFALPNTVQKRTLLLGHNIYFKIIDSLIDFVILGQKQRSELLI